LPVLILFALSLGQMGSRGKRLPALFSALAIYFCYTNFTGLAVAAMRKSELALSPVLGLWTIHGVFALVAIYLFWCRANNRPLLAITSRPVET
jgi:lipopolysaccharide export LptBFGC system permease protein LptF